MNRSTQRSGAMVSALANSIRGCSICTGLPLGPKPIFQFNENSRILIAGQAPGRITHEKGIPFDDPSGNRLRDWLGVTPEQFYDPDIFAIVPMGFCFPGSGKGGDLPPRTECADNWREKVLDLLEHLELILVVGKYAMDWHLGDRKKKTLTQTVAHWQDFWPDILPMPHPSPRNGMWLRRNPWFEEEVLPVLKQKVRPLLQG